MKKIALLVSVLLLALVVVIPVAAGGWTNRVSGGMSDSSPYDGLTVTLSAWQTTDGAWGGQGEYYYPGNGNNFHLEVTKVCFGTWAGGNYDGKPYAVGIGALKYQAGSISAPYAAIAVVDGGKALPDGVRVLAFETYAAAETYCGRGNPGVGATVVDGNFNIRAK
jgi:hypothetical protein